MNKRLAGTGLAIGLVAGAGAGLILEMAGSAGATSGAAVAVRAAVQDTTGSTVPTDPSAPAATTKPDPSTRLQEILQPLIDDGTITQAQADKVIAALGSARPDGPMGGPKGGPMGRHGFGGLRGFGLDVVANALGITADEVRTALQSGQSLADLAVSKGKTAQDVIDAIVAEATTKINDKVTAGDITQAQADKLLATVTTMATDFVNNTSPAGGPGFDGPGMGPGMGRGFGGPGSGGPGFGGPGHQGNDNDADDSPANAPVDTTAPTVAG
jgi:hypothetical protein